MLWQGLHFKMLFTLHFDWLRWISRLASRNIPLKLRYMEDIVYILEPAPEVQSIGCLSYALQHPEGSHKPSFELPSACQMKGLRG